MTNPPSKQLWVWQACPQMASWSLKTCFLSCLYFLWLPVWGFWLSNFVQKASQLFLYKKTCVGTACGVTWTSLCGFREVPCSNTSMAALLAIWTIRAGRDLEPVQSNCVTLHERREGRKEAESTAEIPSLGVGLANRIPWDGVMSKLRSQGELKAKGNWVQSDKRTFLRVNKASTPVLTRASGKWYLRFKQPKWVRWNCNP